MSQPDPREWKLGDVANGHILTHDGWQPLPNKRMPTWQIVAVAWATVLVCVLIIAFYA